MNNKISVVCERCGNTRDMSRGSFANFKRRPTFCRLCPENRNKRSEIAKRSNKNREIRPEFLQFVELVKKGSITFKEIANILKKDDSTVCSWFNRRGIRSRFGGKSFQEDEVYQTLIKIFPDVKRQVRYGKTRHRADFYINNIGYVEYDGFGFYHMIKGSDQKIDAEFHPVRLDTQAVFGGEPYLRFKLLGDKTEYCSASSEELVVRRVDKVSIANRFLACHPLGTSKGLDVFGLFYKDLMIGVAKFDNSNLKRWFVLDGAPQGSAEKLIRNSLELLQNINVHAYIYDLESETLLTSLGWKVTSATTDYELVRIGGKIVNTKTLNGFLKKTKLNQYFKTEPVLAKRFNSHGYG